MMPDPLPPSRNVCVAQIIDHHRHHLAENPNVVGTSMGGRYQPEDGSTLWELVVHYRDTARTSAESLGATFALVALHERIAQEAGLSVVPHPRSGGGMFAWSDDGLTGIIAWKGLP